MAGDWIKLQHATPDKPEIWQLSEILDIAPEQVVGHLLRLWIWCDQQLLNSNAVNVTDVLIESVTRCKGMARALKKVGWLEGENYSFSFTNYDRHNGKSAKNRALTAQRVAESRAKTCNENVTHESLPEKRREENIKKGTKVPKEKPKKWTLPEHVNAKAWNEFEAHRKEIAKPLTDRARSKNATILENLTPEQQQASVDQTIANRWTGLFKPKGGNHETSQGLHNNKTYPESRSARADRIWRERNGGETTQGDVDQLRRDIQSGAGLSASAESVGEILDGEFTREKS